MTTELKGITEGLLFASGEEGMTMKQIAKALHVTTETVEHLLHELSFDYEHTGRGMKLMQSKDIFHLTTKPEHSQYYKALYKEKGTSRMSQAALETLAIIAYRQPITKVEIDEVRGVSSDHAVKGLINRDLIESAGRKETAGRPYFFVTTTTFLTYFGLTSLEELPVLPDHLDMTSSEHELDLFFGGEDKPEKHTEG